MCAVAKKLIYSLAWLVLVLFQQGCNAGQSSFSIHESQALTSLSTLNYSIVFVHLGDELPSYFVEATSQARLFNPEADIYAIVDSAALQNTPDPRFTLDNVSFVTTNTLPVTAQHEKFRKLSVHDVTFRKGYWRKATERFFYVDALMQQYNLTDVFHMEYDTMLYADLSTMMRAFHEYAEIGAVFNNDDHCIPCFLYFKSSSGLTKLTHFLSDNASYGWNDMIAIANYKKQYGAMAVDHLPLLMPSYLVDNALVSIYRHTTPKPENYINRFNVFQSIFDANALGQYLGGIDPRDGHSQPGYINEGNLFDPGKLSISWEVDEHNRKVPYASDGRTKCRVNNSLNLGVDG
jgi:hypothetical protein